MPKYLDDTGLAYFWGKLKTYISNSTPSPSSSTPQALGTASAGTSAKYSREDHVHAKPSYTKSDIGLGNVDNVRQYSEVNPPPYTSQDVTSSFTTSKGTFSAYRSGNMVTVTFVGDSTTYASDEVIATISAACRPVIPIDAVGYIGRQAVVVRIKTNGDVVMWVTTNLSGNQRLYFSTTYPVA